MDIIAFHQWVQQTSRVCSDQNLKPDDLKEGLLERLIQNIYTLDETVLAVVHGVNGYESSHISNGRQEFKDTIELIDTLQPLLYDRILLKSKLLMHKANLLEFKGMRKQAADTYDKSVSLLQELHLEVDKNWIQSMLKQASIFLEIDDRDKAENLYLDILSYPWTLIEEPEYFQIFRDYYLEAGKGLIECRRGNLEELKNIFFVPAANEILRPILEKAINEIQN